MKDRLGDLKALVGDGQDYHSVEMESRRPFMDDFFTQIEDYQQSLACVKEKIQEIKKKHSTILSSPQPDEKVKEELDQLVNEVQSLMSSLKMNLLKMEKNVKELESTSQGNFAEIRIKKCQHLTLVQELADTMSEYDNIQNNYKENCKNRIKRQLQIVNPNSSVVEDAAFEEMIESDNPAIFTQGIITDTQQAKNSLREIEARHNDIIKLENSIKQLHELFTDVAHFVASQGEMIDRIEYNVENATEYVKEAVKDTNKALRYRASSLKKKLFCAVICLVLLIIIGVGLYVGLAE